jgi:hypothetical protein
MDWRRKKASIVFAFYEETNGISYCTIFLANCQKHHEREPFHDDSGCGIWMSKLNLIVTISLESSISVIRA